MKIIYKNLDNSISIITPTQEELDLHGIEAIAKKDVPAPCEYVSEWKEEEIDGKLVNVPAKYETYYTPYKIVDENEIPSDRTFRNAWEWDDTVDPDGVGSFFNTFEEIE